MTFTVQVHSFKAGQLKRAQILQPRYQDHPYTQRAAHIMSAGVYLSLLPRLRALAVPLGSVCVQAPMLGGTTQLGVMADVLRGEHIAPPASWRSSMRTSSNPRFMQNYIDFFLVRQTIAAVAV